MTAKEIFESIDLSQLPKEAADKFRKVEKATKGFTIESDKVNTFMRGAYKKIKETKPTALKNLKVEEKITKKEVKKGKTTEVVENLEYKVKGKKKVSKKTPTPSKPKRKGETAMERAKKIRKKDSSGKLEPWNTAFSRAQKELKAEAEKAKKDAEKVVSTTSQALKNLEKMIQNDPKLKGYPRTYGKQSKRIDANKDAKIKAKPAGKRVSKKGHKNQYGESKGGRVYWENRDNRSDRYAPNFPNKVYLEMGGKTDDLGFPTGHTFLVVEVSPSGDKKLIKSTKDYMTALMSSAVARGMKSSKDARVVIVDKEDKKVIHEAFEAGGEITITPTQLINNPDALVGTTTMSELFEFGGVTAYQEGGEVFITPNPLLNAGSGDYVAGSNTMSNMFDKGGELENKYGNRGAELLDVRRMYSSDRLQVISEDFNLLSEINKKEFGGQGLIEKYGTSSNYVLYQPIFFAKGGYVTPESFIESYRNMNMSDEEILDYAKYVVEIEKIQREASDNPEFKKLSIRRAEPFKGIIEKLSTTTMAKGGNLSGGKRTFDVEFQKERHGKVVHKEKISGKNFANIKSRAIKIAKEKGYGVASFYVTINYRYWEDDPSEKRTAYIGYVDKDDDWAFTAGGSYHLSPFNTKNVKKVEEMYEFAKGGVSKMEKGGQVIEYSKVLQILKEKIDDAVDDISSIYENAHQAETDEVEHTSRSGFIPFTNGGYRSRWFEYSFALEDAGEQLPTKSLEDKIEELRERTREIAREEIQRNYPDEVEELGGIENVSYGSLEERGFYDLAEEYDEIERDDDDSIMMEVEALYYYPDNPRAEDEKHTINLSGVVNLESPYHRSGNLEDFIEERFTFDTYKQLEDKLDKALAEVVGWFEGKKYEKNPRDLTIRRMQSGGFIAMYNGKRVEIDADTLYEAKKKAIKELKVPKSKQGLLSVMANQAMENQDFRFMAKGGQTLPSAQGIIDNLRSQGVSDEIILNLAIHNFNDYLKRSGSYKNPRGLLDLAMVHYEIVQLLRPNVKMEKGGRLGFEGLAKKVAKRYEGKPVKAKYQKDYGKTYSKEEAMEVGRKVAAKVYGQQQANMKKMAKGGEVDGKFNLKVKDYLDAYLKGTKVNSPEYQESLMLILKGALRDANYHSEARQVDNYFPKAGKVYIDTPMEGVIEDKGVDIAKMAKWDGHKIIDAFAYYTNLRIGGGFGNKLMALKGSTSFAKGGSINFKERTIREFKKGEIVYDTSNKRYGIVIWKAEPIKYNSDLYELRLDSDGMQPTENLRKLGEAGDVGTKKQLFDAVSSYERLRQEYPSMNYPEIINNPFFAKGGSLMGHGLQLGDKIVEDLGSVLKVTTKDGGMVYVDLASGYRGKDMPLPFEKGGAVGGLKIPDIAKKFGKTTADVMKKLEIGAKHEMEHTTDPKKARKIALDHLSKDLDYYTKLNKLGL